MESFMPTLLIIFFCIVKACLAAENSNSNSTNESFIKNSCGVTRYPDVCYATLSVYASSIQKDPAQLANAALSVTLERAKNASKAVEEFVKSHKLKAKEAGAMKDCVEMMKDSVEELQESLVAMRDIEGPDFEMKMGNIQTWVSAALTYEDTCMDGFAGKEQWMKESLRSVIVRVAQLTSNALALINELR